MFSIVKWPVIPSSLGIRKWPLEPYGHFSKPTVSQNDQYGFSRPFLGKWSEQIAITSMVWIRVKEKAKKNEKSILFQYFSLTLTSGKIVHVWFEFFPSYLSRKKGTSGTFLSFGLRPQLQKNFLQFPFSYFGNLGKTQIRRGQFFPQTCQGKISKQNTIFWEFFLKLETGSTLNA